MARIFRSNIAETRVSFGADIEMGYDCGDFSIAVGGVKLRIAMPGPYCDEEEAREAWVRLRKVLRQALADCEATIVDLDRVIEERRRAIAERIASAELTAEQREELLGKAVTAGEVASDGGR